MNNPGKEAVTNKKKAQEQVDLFLARHKQWLDQITDLSAADRKYIDDVVSDLVKAAKQLGSV